MRSINLTRLTIGSLVILGLVFWTPLAYFVAGMMIFAGLTNICLLERLFARAFGTATSCSGAPGVHVSTQCGELNSGQRSQAMKLGLILSTNDSETAFNALRLANFSKAQGDEVTVFLLGKGVELEQIGNDKFDVRGQAELLLKAGGRFAACGTCLRLRAKEGSEVCPLSTMKDLYELLRESDRVISF